MKTMKTFAGIPQEYARQDQSKIVLIPVPFDQTTTWQKGADYGPTAFLNAAENMELYDIETDSEVYKNGIFLTESIDEDTSEAMVDAVHNSVKSFINKKKFVTLFGGEHSISIGSIRAFNECYDNLTVLQIDAHADLRKEYEGSPYNHACAMYEASQNTNLIQVGIRSMDSSEKTVMNEDKVYFAHELATDDYWMDDVVDQLTEHVYITFDLDALDPSIMPSTGTPEPGGLLYYETLEFLKKVFESKNVVGFDMVELCPNHLDKSSDFLASKLYYKMLSYKFFNDELEDDDFYGDETNQKANHKFKYRELEEEEY
jgi:agmatinase